MLLAEVERFPHLGKERGEGEPNEEGAEEGDPRHVEGAHVWAFPAEELDFCGLVILRRVDFDVVGLVFLDFLSLSWGQDARCIGNR